MGEYLDQIPESLHGHIRSVTKSSGLSYSEESVEKIAKAWLDKKQIFEDQTNQSNMEEVTELAKDDERGALAITYSGSLVNIGPLVDNVRKVVYTSIGMRTDAPDTAEEEKSEIVSDIKVDEIIEFSVGPVKSTSKIFKIAACNSAMSPEDMEENLTQVMTLVEDKLIEVNKTILSDE
ncbi:MAG: hypothetical protein JW969_17570 [Spirochaetales bacterium]|nr:hypothetical protein [Spirochaetales bacterium]